MDISVRVSDLKVKLDELIKDDIDCVELSILDGELFDGIEIPKTLNFAAFDGTGGIVDYDDIEEVHVDAFYKFNRGE